MRQRDIRKLPMDQQIKREFGLSHRQAAERARVNYTTYRRAIDPSNGEKPNLETVAKIIAASGGFFRYEDFLDAEAKMELRRVRESYFRPPTPRKRAS